MMNLILAMSINDLAKVLGDACYGFLALNFLWGLYNVIMGFRRVRELAFGGHDEQAEYVDEVVQNLQAGNFSEVEEITSDDARGARRAPSERGIPAGAQPVPPQEHRRGRQGDLSRLRFPLLLALRRAPRSTTSAPQAPGPILG